MGTESAGRSWVDRFVDETAETASPTIFRRWAAISAIAGALERKVWVTTRGERLYANLYVILVGPPGVGKTIVLNRERFILDYLQEHQKASASLTRASYIDELHDSKRNPIINGAFVGNFHSLTAVVNELGVFLPEYDPAFMNTLTSIYDGHRYNEKRRTKDLSIDIPEPFFNMISGTTPSYLGSFLPDGAWDQGFISRNIMIYSGDAITQSPFKAVVKNDMIGLGKDLRLIGNMAGELHFSKEAITAYEAWFSSPALSMAPDHPRLISYNARRGAHLLKLCVISAIAGNSSKTIEIDHFQIALGWLIEAESTMPDIFRAMIKGGDAQAIEDCWYFMSKRAGSTNKPVPEGEIKMFLSARVPLHKINLLIDLIVSTGHATRELSPGGHMLYRPLPRPPGFI